MTSVFVSSSDLFETPFDEFLNTILARVPGVASDLIKMELRNTLRDFFYQSTCWRREIGPYHLRAGRGDVPMDPVDANTDVCFPHRVWYDKRELRPSAPMAYSEDLSDDGPSFFFATEPGVLQVWPAPKQTKLNSIRVLASLLPERQAIQVPKMLISHFFDVIVDGTLARLFSMPSRPFSSPDLAVYHQKKYLAGVSRARQSADRGFTQAAPHWRFPRFA